MSKKQSLTDKQLESLKAKLHDDLNKAESIGTEEILAETDDTNDEADMASADYTQAQSLRMRNRSIFYIKKLGNALKKIESGEYGFCEDCGANIKFQRLIARPTAELCIDCKEEAERDEMTSFISRQPKSIGETMRVPTTLQ